MVATRADPAAKVTASTANGIQAAAENRSPPTGGPASSWVATWVSTSVCPVPSRNPTAASRAMLARSARTATARPPTMANRAASTVHITRRRSHRSSRAPLSSPNSSHGSHSAKLTSDTSNGSRVSVAASKGSAVPYTPSPGFEVPCAVQSLANPVPPATSTDGRYGARPWQHDLAR